MVSFKRVSMLSYVLLASSAVLFSQEVKVKKISLRDFPDIKAVVSIENTQGAPLLIDPSRLRLYENDIQIYDVKIIPQDSLTVPIFSVIVLDKSGSMRGEAIENARKGAIAFVRAMRAGDQAAYIEFDTEVDVVSGFSADAELLTRKILATNVGSNTALLDAVCQAAELHKTAPSGAVKVTLVLTDGKENRSQRTVDETVEISQAANASVYAIGLGNQIEPEMLRRVAADTEANYYPAPKPDSLIEIYTRISQLLHSQLMLEFKTPFSYDNRWHTLRIVIPYMGRDISGVKRYLSALEAEIPSDVLLQMGRDRQQREAERNATGRLGYERKERETVFILVSAAVVLLLVLLLIVVLKKKR